MIQSPLHDSWMEGSGEVVPTYLSLHRISTPARDSMADNFCTIARFFARNAAPTAIVVVMTAGRPTGTPMMVIASVNVRI